ncbi:MAG: tryptophan synthase subunit beta [Verrucomicrobia bacterium]|nr:tryptophan synthase subunit beta [Verrucomicrobiota bacterium]
MPTKSKPIQYDPDANGHFGEFGGRYIGETLMPALIELDAAHREAWADPTFREEFAYYLKHYVGRPSPLYFAERLTKACGGARIYLKREDLNHTGAHKVNNTVGQALLARRMGKRRLMAETGAGQHGVATATVAALFGMECVVYMGAEDIQRQAPNVKRMNLLGAEVVSVTSGTRTLKDAMSEALRVWTGTVENTFYVIGSVAGPHPYPQMVRDFQRIIGDEAREQIQAATGRLPDEVIACVGGGSNAAGIFAAFLDDAKVKLVGIEAAGHGIQTGAHAASISAGGVGILHGSKTYILQDADGQILNAHSISAGLDYPGVGPLHAYWHATGRAEYRSITDDEALASFHELTRLEGIIPALESAHALAAARQRACQGTADDLLLVNLSGRGDKDLDAVLALAH